jgi:tRNA 2-thiouridine synthesizing protein A
MATPTTLDLKGLKCPLPVLRANKALRGMAGGTLVEVLVTDAAAPKDFRAYCETTGHEFLACAEEAGGLIRISLRKKKD